MEYLAVGPYCWGRGKTPKEAIKNMKANWPSGVIKAKPTKSVLEDPQIVNIYQGEDLAIDQMGRISGRVGIERIQ